MKEIVLTLVTPIRVGDHCGVHLPARLARYSDPMLAVPVSLVGTFMFFPLLWFFHKHTFLFGLVLAIGLVVDDAIVVVEAVERHIEEASHESGGSQSDGRNFRPGGGYRARSFGGFHSDGFSFPVSLDDIQQFAVTIAISVILSAFNRSDA